MLLGADLDPFAIIELVDSTISRDDPNTPYKNTLQKSQK